MILKRGGKFPLLALSVVNAPLCQLVFTIYKSYIVNKRMIISKVVTCKRT